eukprot:260725-Prymnesium_polylepis.1
MLQPDRPAACGRVHAADSRVTRGRRVSVVPQACLFPSARAGGGASRGGMESLLKAGELHRAAELHSAVHAPGQTCRRCADLTNRILSFESQLKDVQGELAAKDAELKRLKGLLGQSVAPPITQH